MSLVRSFTSRSSNLDEVLADLDASSSVLEALRMLPEVVAAAEASEPSTALALLAPRTIGPDALTARIALRALAKVSGLEVSEYLASIVARGEGLATHAAWALSERRPHPAALSALAELAAAGGFATMMAELAIENWMKELPELAWRPELPEGLRRLAKLPEPPPTTPRRAPGLRIAQVLMQGRVDAGLSSAATGDGGGLITLQVGLTEELANHLAVGEVFLVTRAIHGEEDSLAKSFEPVGQNGTIARLEFGPDRYLATSEMWEFRADLEKQLEHFLVTQGPFDALHLRFADVGTFAAARLGRELGIPIYFTLAPDPHSLIASWEASGSLTKENFGEFDDRDHLLFRAWLVEWMLNDAEKLALLPRVDQRETFMELLGVDIAAQSERFVVIPEGIHFDRIDEARDEVRDGRSRQSVLVDLEAEIRRLPTERQGLPIVLSVGRLNPVKGFDRLVESWRTHPAISQSFNLVIVGGNLANPSEVESETLSAIEGALGGASPEESGLILLGGRSHSEVALLMAAAHGGHGRMIGPSGMYVAASQKEEFGLAIVEAMAAGLPVVAPESGGPGVYVDHEVTGYLANSDEPGSLARGMLWADANRGSELRSARARHMVRIAYSLSAMANDLVDLYKPNIERPIAS